MAEGHESWFCKFEIIYFHLCVESYTILGLIPVLKNVSGNKYFRKNGGKN